MYITYIHTSIYIYIHIYIYIYIYIRICMGDLARAVARDNDVVIDIIGLDVRGVGQRFWFLL